MTDHAAFIKILESVPDTHFVCGHWWIERKAKERCCMLSALRHKGIDVEPYIDENSLESKVNEALNVDSSLIVLIVDKGTKASEPVLKPKQEVIDLLKKELL